MLKLLTFSSIINYMPPLRKSIRGAIGTTKMSMCFLLKNVMLTRISDEIGDIMTEIENMMN